MTAAQPAATRALLDALNHEQAALDALMNRIRGKQWQLFADWYKYLVALYPHGAVTTNPLNVSAADIAAFMKGESNDRIPGQSKWSVARPGKGHRVRSRKAGRRRYGAKQCPCGEAPGGHGTRQEA